MFLCVIVDNTEGGKQEITRSYKRMMSGCWLTYNSKHTENPSARFPSNCQSLFFFCLFHFFFLFCITILPQCQHSRLHPFHSRGFAFNPHYSDYPEELGVTGGKKNQMFALQVAWSGENVKEWRKNPILKPIVP